MDNSGAQSRHKSPNDAVYDFIHDAVPPLGRLLFDGFHLCCEAINALFDFINLFRLTGLLRCHNFDGGCHTVQCGQLLGLTVDPVGV